MNLQNLATELAEKYNNKGITSSLINRLLGKAFHGHPWNAPAPEEELDTDLERIARFLVEWYADSNAERRDALGKVILGYARDYKALEKSRQNQGLQDLELYDEPPAPETFPADSNQTPESGDPDISEIRKPVVRKKKEPRKTKSPGHKKKGSCIAILGVPHSGKTAYLYVLGKHLQKGCFGKKWRYRFAGREYQQLLFEQEKKLDEWEKIEPEGTPWRLPLFSLRRRAGLIGAEKISIEYFDPGETPFPNTEERAQETDAPRKTNLPLQEYLKDCDGFLFLLDSAVFDHREECAAPARQKEWLDILNAWVRAAARGKRKLDRPVAVVFNKADLFDGDPPAEGREPVFELQEAILTAFANQTYPEKTTKGKNALDAVLEETRTARSRAARNFARKKLPILYGDLRKTAPETRFFAISCWGLQPQPEEHGVSIVQPECPVAIYEPLAWLAEKISERARAQKGAQAWQKAAMFFLLFLVFLLAHFALGVHAIPYLCKKNLVRTADVLFLTAERNPLNYLSFHWFRPSFEKTACVLAATHHERLIRGSALPFAHLTATRENLLKACRMALRGGRPGKDLLAQYLSEDARDELEKSIKQERIFVFESLRWFRESLTMIRQADMWEQEVASDLFDVKHRQVMFFLEKEKTGVDLLDGTIAAGREERVPADLLDNFAAKTAREIRAWSESVVHQDPRRVLTVLSSLPSNFDRPEEIKGMLADQTWKAHLSLAETLVAGGGFEEAMKEFAAANEIRPDAGVFKKAAADFCQAANTCLSNEDYGGLFRARDQAWQAALKTPSAKDEVRNQMQDIAKQLAENLHTEEAKRQFRWCINTAEMSSAQGSAAVTFVNVLRTLQPPPNESADKKEIRAKIAAAAEEFDVTGSWKKEIEELLRDKEEEEPVEDDEPSPDPPPPPEDPVPPEDPRGDNRKRRLDSLKRRIERGDADFENDFAALRQQLSSEEKKEICNAFQTRWRRLLDRNSQDEAAPEIKAQLHYALECADHTNLGPIINHGIIIARHFLRCGEPEKALPVLETLLRGRDSEEIKDLKAHAVRVSEMAFVPYLDPDATRRGFYMDVYEVAAREYTEWAGKESPQRLPMKNPHPGGPVVCITWEDADAYAKAHHKRLPTEKEWERAMKTKFPWGSAYRPNDAVIAGNGYNGPVGKPEPGARFPMNDCSAFGIYNLLGNVREWVADADPDPEKRTFRIIKGSSWFLAGERGAQNEKTSHRMNEAFEDVGFRCVADPLPGETASSRGVGLPR